jgi:tetratricopeptide (TPR) repeat protein
MKTGEIRTCPSCGNEIYGGMDFCPVCMLRGGIAGSFESGESFSSEDTVALRTPGQWAQRLGHYELVTDQEGRPVELGRGAMGITYKAIDVYLRCPVTLKVISERYLSDRSARIRFLREARAAASVRHPNVASVFHLGKTDQNYFYAMEFVEGKTLEDLIRQSGRLKVKLALDITMQVAGGLAAIHKQKLVHRDIKPSNIMVTPEEGGMVIAKIIDLGLAKPAPDSGDEASISVPGAFAGTPEFASPEQFAGVGVDIRSDIYSLGVVLWKMLTGQVVFRGSAAEVMYKHQHAPLPFDLLEGVPQPVVVLLEVLLEKDPRRRFENPSELTKAIPTITGAITARRRIARQNLQKIPEGRVRSPQKPTETLGAYDLYLRGMALVELLDRDANQKAIEFFKKAVKQDPNFALVHIGLARAYVEEAGFGGKKSLLDSAVTLCRLAIALDPAEVRGYDQLARAYFLKGWYPQCDEALKKALELGPNDGHCIAFAARRALAKQQFDESYKLFRKAHSLDPNEPRWVYVAAEIIFRMDLDDVAEKWMQQALEREANPQRHQMMECYRMMWRRKFAAARAGFMQLPLDLKDYNYSVSDGLFFCAIGTGDWTTVIQYCNNQLEKEPDKVWARTYLGVALQISGRLAEAQEVGLQVLERGLERMERPAQPDAPWDAPLYLAWAYRLLGEKDKAYRHLEKYLANRTLLEIPLGLGNPMLEIFKNDAEFKAILADVNLKFEIARRSIREHEARLLKKS